MQVVPAHGQHLGAALQMNLRGFVVMSLDMADRAQIYDNRSMDLRKLSGIELSEPPRARHMAAGVQASCDEGRTRADEWRQRFASNEGRQ